MRWLGSLLLIARAPFCKARKENAVAEARFPRAESFQSRIVRLSEGEDIDVQTTLQALVENGFVRTDLVGEAGEFAFRGGILDLLPPNAPKPLRVELFGDTIDSLRWFEVESQRSEDESGPQTIMPMTQFPLTRETRHALARRMSLDFNHPIYKRDVAEKIERLNENGTFPGIEHYIPASIVLRKGNKITDTFLPAQ